MIHALADNVKIKLDKSNPHGFKASGEATNESQESGILVELPDITNWIGMHSFAFERSFLAKIDISDLLEEYKKLIGKRVYYESFQDSGRRIKEGDDEFVFLKLTDIIAYSDADVKAKTVSDVRRAGSFKA